MSLNAPDHFSYKYELNLDKIPTKRSDRIALNLLLPGLIAGLFLIALGIYELTMGQRPQNNPEISTLLPPWFSLIVFDGIIILLGLWIIVSLLLSYLRYKKVFFDGKKVTLIYRTPFGAKTTIKESIKKYEGVRFRVEFFQFGFINKNKYIIELYHKDFDKTVPLYISTSGHDIRKIWEYYALKLNMPQIITTKDGIAKRESKDVGKSLLTMYNEGLLQNDFSLKSPLPASVAWVCKKDKSVIKPRRIRWDSYNLLTATGIFLALAVLLLNIKNLFSNIFTSCMSLLLLAVIIYLFTKLITKDKLVIKPHKIVIVLKTLAFSRKKYEVLKKDIQTIDIAYSPVSERNFLAIIGGDKTLVFGKKLPIEDLRWVRSFLINDIVKK